MVAMSGGVDSSVAAAILQRQGYEVIGISLKLPEMSPHHGQQRTCCGQTGVKDAGQVARDLGIPFYALNYEQVFEQEVIEPFCRAYLTGHTPNPCVDCNARVKFGRLLDTTLALRADYLATGHYARVERDPLTGRPALRKGLDRKRDQSYFLYMLTAAQLAHVLFPLGDLDKETVRETARDLGLHVSGKPGSQDICFLQGAPYQDYLARRRPEAFQPGAIVDRQGGVLGVHRGVAAYTVGQRKGLGLSAGRALYVQAIDVASNRVVVGPKNGGERRAMRLEQVNWSAQSGPETTLRLAVKVRYRAAEAPAEVTPLGGGGASVRFLQPQPPAAPGQSAVFYDGDRVIGGGIINSYE
jgi:tRNA-uridine 2-sulfurtransferase